MVSRPDKEGTRKKSPGRRRGKRWILSGKLTPHANNCGNAFSFQGLDFSCELFLLYKRRPYRPGVCLPRIKSRFSVCLRHVNHLHVFN